MSLLVLLRATATPRLARAAEPFALAIIVNSANPAPDASLAELRAIFTLDRQFWPDGRRIALLLPSATGATARQRQVLLDRVYGMSDAELRQHWVGQLFRGAIPAIPSTVRSREALVAAVQGSDGAITAVAVSDVPAGVRVLKIDGKGPSDPGYPLAEPSRP